MNVILSKAKIFISNYRDSSPQATQNDIFIYKIKLLFTAVPADVSRGNGYLYFCCCGRAACTRFDVANSLPLEVIPLSGEMSA